MKKAATERNPALKAEAEKALWLVMGASSSMARAFANEAARAGAQLLLAGRDLEDLERTAKDLRVRFGTGVEAIAFDAADTGSHSFFAQDIETRTKNAGATLSTFVAFGSMPENSAMEADPDTAQECLMATYSGLVSVLLHLAPVMEAQQAGHIVILGSVAGDRGRVKNYIYGSAKAGVEVFAAGLRNRLGRAGVSVTLVKPGFVDTAMSWGVEGMFLVATPDAIGRACLRYANQGSDIHYFPWFWRIIMLIIRSIPERLFKKLSI